jgi:dienelactone hydrolase
VTGTGPHEVVIETNSDNGIKCGTIYRPKDLGGAQKYPILVWGEGGCSQNGYDNLAAMGEIASWGYFIIADGTPGGNNACAGGQNSSAFSDYVTWATAENGKSCSAYYQSLETAKVAADGFSCGGLMAENASGDARFSAIGITSSGLMSANAALYEKIHTPFKIMNGGSGDIAYENGLRDYQEISSRGKPIIYFSKTSAGHGGDLSQARGDFNQVNLAWLNWQLKGDTGATGKGFLMGASCKFCMDTGWTYKSANIQ